ncbi:MAG: hypothetical protein WCJ58_02800 [bacterium]
MLPQISADLFPKFIQDVFDLMGPGGSNAVNFVVGRVQLALFIVVGGLVLVAVVYALIASFKYIRSQGDPGQIEEAQKAIKAIFFGLGSLVIAIIGIVLIFVFFGLKAPTPTVAQTCISAPGSIGCQSCQENSKGNICVFCEAIYAAVANSTLNDVNGDGVIDQTDIKVVRQINGLTGNGFACVN